MQYPVVLTPEELQCLRYMLRTVASNRVFGTALTYREHVKGELELVKMVHPTVLAQAGRERDRQFMLDILNLNDTYRKLDHPLFHASVVFPTTSVILTLPQEPFETLRKIASLEFHEDREDPAPQVAARVKVAQPAILAAFEVAEAQALAKADPNMPAAQGLN